MARVGENQTAVAWPRQTDPEEPIERVPAVADRVEPVRRDPYAIDVVRQLARGRCDQALSCVDAHRRYARSAILEVPIEPGTTLEEALDSLEADVSAWARENPALGIPVSGAFLYVEGFTLDLDRRVGPSARVTAGLDVGSMGEDIDLFARAIHHFDSSTSVSVHAEFDVEQRVFAGTLELLHHRPDDRLTLAFHAGAATRPYQLERVVTDWPLNSVTGDWQRAPLLRIREYEEQVGYQVGLAMLYRFGDE
ncbi:MAG: hypothetical protein AAFX94_00730 [Myxococcota bacterium]